MPAAVKWTRASRSPRSCASPEGERPGGEIFAVTREAGPHPGGALVAGRGRGSGGEAEAWVRYRRERCRGPGTGSQAIEAELSVDRCVIVLWSAAAPIELGAR